MAVPSSETLTETDTETLDTGEDTEFHYITTLYMDIYTRFPYIIIRHINIIFNLSGQDLYMIITT
jgi:hypothetical protein